MKYCGSGIPTTEIWALENLMGYQLRKLFAKKVQINIFQMSANEFTEEQG